MNVLVLPPFESTCNLKDEVEAIKKLKEELKAIQNSMIVLERVLELRALVKLIKMVKTSLSEESIQALYVGYMMSQDIQDRDVNRFDLVQGSDIRCIIFFQTGSMAIGLVGPI